MASEKERDRSTDSISAVCDGIANAVRKPSFCVITKDHRDCVMCMKHGLEEAKDEVGFQQLCEKKRG